MANDCLENCRFLVTCDKLAAGADVDSGHDQIGEVLAFSDTQGTAAKEIRAIAGPNCSSKVAGDPAHCVIVGAATLYSALNS